MSANSGLSEAPPTRKPSTSGHAERSGAFFALAEPPYWMRILAATSGDTCRAHVAARAHLPKMAAQHSGGAPHMTMAQLMDAAHKNRTDATAAAKPTHVKQAVALAAKSTRVKRRWPWLASQVKSTGGGSGCHAKSSQQAVALRAVATCVS